MRPSTIRSTSNLNSRARLCPVPGHPCLAGVEPSAVVAAVHQLLGVAAKTKRSDLLAYGLLIGLVAGFLTDAIVTAGGA